MRERRQLRQRLRGHAWCNRNDGFARLRATRNGLVDVHVGTPKVWVSGFFGASAASAELVARQFVIERIGGRLNGAFFQYLGSGTPIRLGMPGIWRDYLITDGWKVDRFRSALAWQGAILARFAQGVFQAMRLCIVLWRGDAASRSPGRHVMFESLSPVNLPATGTVQTSHDICSFYARWPGRLADLTMICHGIANAKDRSAEGYPVRYRKPAWELASGRCNALRLARWTLVAGVVAGVQLLAGRWQYALLLGEAARARAVRLCPPEALASEYLFHASATIYRPMWTYEVKHRNSEVSLYFYSTFVQPKLARGYEAQNYDWGPANWPRYIVWDAWQEAMLRRDLGHEIQVIRAGAIAFSDSGKAMPEVPDRSVAVFSIQPFRPSAHFGISTLEDCLAEHPDYFIRFLEDIAEVVEDCGGTTVLKEKRDISGRGDRRYARMLDKLLATKRMSMVDPAISAVRAVTACRASISVPFTSTAIYGRECGVSSVYYDPAGWLQPDDVGAHGIPVVRGKAELRAWLEQVFETSEPISPAQQTDGIPHARNP